MLKKLQELQVANASFNTMRKHNYSSIDSANFDFYLFLALFLIFTVFNFADTTLTKPLNNNIDSNKLRIESVLVAGSNFPGCFRIKPIFSKKITQNFD